MKKLLLGTLVSVGLLLSMSSCHKFCQCRFYESGVVVFEDEVEDITGIYKNCVEYTVDLNHDDPDYDEKTNTRWVCSKY